MFAKSTSSKKREENRGLRSNRARLTLEGLESRDVPSGIVTPFYSGLTGNLTLVGDANSNQVTIGSFGINQVLVTPVGGTVLNIGGFLISDPTPLPLKHNLNIFLGAGNDTIRFDLSGSLSIPGNLNIDYGGANAGVGDKVTQTVNASSALETRRLIVFSNINIRYATGFVTTNLSNLAVSGSVNIVHAAGDSVLRIDNLDPNPTFSHIGGNLVVINTVGEAQNRIVDTNIDHSVAILNGNPRAADNSAGFNQIFNLNNTATQAIIGGNVLISNLGGDSTIGDDLADIHVFGTVQLRLGNGHFNTRIAADAVDDRPVINGHLVVLGGTNWTGTMNFGARPAVATRGLTVGRNFFVRTGNRDATINIDDVTVLRATSIFSGNGVDTINIDGTAGDDGSIFAGTFVMGTGPGTDLVNINSGAAAGSLTQFKGAVSVNMGNDADVLNLALASTVRFVSNPAIFLVLDGGLGANDLFVHDPNVSPLGRTPVFRNFTVHHV